MQTLQDHQRIEKRLPTPIYTKRCRAFGWGLIYLANVLAWLGFASASLQVGLRGLKLIERGEKFRHGLLDDGGQP